MRGLRPIACLLGGIASVALADDALKFRNGDLLHGAVGGATATGVRWQADGVKQPIQFDLTNLAELQLAPRPPKTSRQLHGLLVELSNGDQLTGDIAGLDEQTLTLNTWYAGKLLLKRAFIKHLESRAVAPAVVYSGPTGLSDWKTGQAGWTYKSGKFYCPRGRYAVIGKEVDLPGVASIEFDVAWRGQPYWSVGFCGSDALNIGTSGYMLSCNSSYLQLIRAGAGNQRNFESGVQVPQLQTRTKVHVAIRVNQPKKTVTVFIDKAMVKQWTDPEELLGKGRSVVFQSQGQADLRLANILITEWDGKLDSESAAPRPANEDLVRLANGDKVSGRLQAITGGEAVLTNSFAAVKIPLAKITGIDFAGKSTEVARRQEADVRAFFADGTQFTVALEQLDDKGLAGSTENCGRVLLPTDTFTRLRFHIYDKFVDSDEDEDWGALPNDGTVPGRRIPFRR